MRNGAFFVSIEKIDSGHRKFPFAMKSESPHIADASITIRSEELRQREHLIKKDARP
jgi:hypothetical protein